MDTNSSPKSAKASVYTSDPAPSTHFLGILEKKGYIKSAWNMNTERPRKEYKLTNDGKDVLSYTEGSLNFICKNIASDTKIGIQAAPFVSARSTLHRENSPLEIV